MDRRGFRRYHFPPVLSRRPVEISRGFSNSHGHQKSYALARDLRSTPIFAEAQFAFFALIFLGGQAGFSTVLTASAVSGSSPHKQARRSS